MKIILKEDIENLGFKYDIVEVKNGYARNYLFPKKHAIAATQGSLKNRKEDLRQKSKKEEELIKKAKQQIEEINNLEIKLAVKTAENGKIFGSIGSQDLSLFFKQKGFEIEKKFIKIAGNTAKTLGEHKAYIRLHREVDEKIISFHVVALLEEIKKNSK